MTLSQHISTTRSGARFGIRALIAFFVLVGFFSAFAATADVDGKPIDAKLTQLDGAKVRLSGLRGKPVLLKIWATWCLPCRQQTHVLHELDDVFAEHETAVYSVNLGESVDVVKEHLEREPSSYPVLLDRVQILASKLDIWEVPALVLLDADGTVVGTATGLTGREGVVELLDHLKEPGSVAAADRSTVAK